MTNMEDNKTIPADLEFDTMKDETASEWTERFLIWVKEKYDAEVYWAEEPSKTHVRANGVVVQHPPWSSWGFVWKHGIICELMPKKEQEQLARMMAAMMSYLWLKGVPIWLSRDLGYLFAKRNHENVQI